MSVEETPDQETPHSPRMEGRIRAIEGILRTKLGGVVTNASDNAIKRLRGATQAGDVLPATREVTPIRAAAPVGVRIKSDRKTLDEMPKVRRAMPSWVFWSAGIAATFLLTVMGWYTNYVYMPQQSCVARLSNLHGKVTISTKDSQWNPDVGDTVPAGADLLTGKDSSVTLVYNDGTVLDLPGDSMLGAVPSDSYSKQISLNRGMVTAHVAPQPASTPMEILTPTSKIIVVGTRFTVEAKDASTLLSVDSGKVKMTRTADQQTIQVGGGFTAVAATGIPLVARPLEFIKGINLGGRSVTIDGHRWLSYKEALADGLSVRKLSHWDHINWNPVPRPDPDTTAMLQSGVFTSEESGDDPLVLTQSIPDGDYKVFVWSTENAASFMRSLSIKLQDVEVATGISYLKTGGWGKYGPYSAKVTNGVLKLEVGDSIHHHTGRHLCGVAIFKIP